MKSLGAVEIVCCAVFPCDLCTSNLKQIRQGTLNGGTSIQPLFEVGTFRAKKGGQQSRTSQAIWDRVLGMLTTSPLMLGLLVQREPEPALPYFKTTATSLVTAIRSDIYPDDDTA